MAALEQKKRNPKVDEEKALLDDQPQERKDGAKLKADIDAVLDEIDDILVENAEVFVKEYVQKGGE